MDTDRQTSARMIRGPRIAILDASRPEDRATYRRWARAVLAFYGLVLAWGCVAILANHSTANLDNQVAQASSQKNSSSQGGR
jgi:hypothetical protein